MKLLTITGLLAISFMVGCQSKSSDMNQVNEKTKTEETKKERTELEKMVDHPAFAGVLVTDRKTGKQRYMNKEELREAGLIR